MPLPGLRWHCRLCWPHEMTEFLCQGLNLGPGCCVSWLCHSTSVAWWEGPFLTCSDRLAVMVSGLGVDLEQTGIPGAWVGGYHSAILQVETVLTVRVGKLEETARGYS